MRKNDTLQVFVSATAGNRVGRGSLRALAIAGIAAVFLATGCSSRERICSSGEYPVKAVGNTTGAACVANGREPPAGYVRYPKGKVPAHVGDRWDEYWSTIIVDSDGKIVKD